MKNNNSSTAFLTAVDISKVLFEFGQIKRKTKMPNGEYESDSHHSFTLALIGYELARQYAPELDANKVIAYGLVHDLTEIITGDIPTLTLSKKELREKYKNDKKALSELEKILKSAPNIFDLVKNFEKLDDEEAKFVYWLDKTMPGLTHLFDDGENLRELGIKDQKAIRIWYADALEKLERHASNPHKTASEVLEDAYRIMHDEILPKKA